VPVLINIEQNTLINFIIIMKRKTIILSILLAGFLAINTQAQIKVPSASDVSSVSKQNINMPDKDFTKDILNALNQGDKLGLSPDKLLKLNNSNKSYVNDILATVGGSGSESQIMEAIGIKKKEREDFIEKLLGKSKAGKYYGLVKKQIEPLLAKYKLAKLFM